jgi:ABC-type branched-subunit amino acid transport system ATPase component/ABC-type branched-subunit amino acid transport system permease subunit
MTEAAHDLYLLVAVVGLGLVVSQAGMPVLAQSAFVAVGGVGAMQLERHGLPIGSAVLLAVALGAAAGALTGALVARAGTAAIALSTWALAWLAYAALLAFPSLSGGAQGLTRPAVDHLETPFGLTFTLTPRFHLVIALALCAGALWATAVLRAGPAGLDAVAMRDDPELAASLGTPVAARRVALTAVAGGLGAVAGAGVSLLLGVAAPADLSPLLALQLFAAVIVAGDAPVAGPLAGFAVIVAIPRLADALASAFGVSEARAGGVITAALLVACIALRPRLRGLSHARWPAETAAGEPPGVDAAPLVARGLVVRLGGAEILRGLDLEVRPGEIHALIGPNGSGKTTALRALAGELPPAAGTVACDARVVRTFQRTAGFPSLSPARQVRLAARGESGGGWALALTGLAARAGDDPATLSAGERRLLQVARAAATEAGVLLLDEPAAGMSADERDRLAQVLRALADGGRAILVVEHDLRLVAGAADVATVLDEGEVIAHGAPSEVIAAPTVRSVYLGVGA